MLDLRVYGKIISTPQQSIAEKRDSLFKEFKLCKPFPTLEEERYKLSPSVSLEYKINYDRQLIFNGNESVIDLSESGTVLQVVSDEKPCEVLSDKFRYESKVTDSLRDEIIKKYDLNTGEVFAMGVASTEKKFGSVKFEISNIYDEEETGVLVEEDKPVEKASDGTDDEEVTKTNGLEEVDDSEIEEDDSEEELYDDEDEDLYDEDDYEDLTEEEDSEDDENLEEDSEDEDEDAFAEDEEEDFEDSEDEESDEEDSDEEDEDLYEDEEEDYEDEDSYIDVTEEDEDDEEVGEDDALEEKYENLEEEDEEDSVVSVEEPIKSAPKSVVKPKFYVPEIEDEDVDSFIESRQEKPIKQETPVQENTPVARAPSLQAPTDLRTFLRQHPNCKIEEVLKYFSKREVESEILKGRIIKRNGTLRSL